MHVKSILYGQKYVDTDWKPRLIGQHQWLTHHVLLQLSGRKSLQPGYKVMW